MDTYVYYCPCLSDASHLRVKLPHIIHDRDLMREMHKVPSIHPVTSLARANPSIHAHGVSNYLGHHCVGKKTCGEKKVSMHSYMPRREKPRVVE